MEWLCTVCILRVAWSELNPERALRVNARVAGAECAAVLRCRLALQCHRSAFVEFFLDQVLPCELEGAELDL